MAKTTTPALTPSQAGRVDRARQALAEECGLSPLELAKHVGILQWHLESVLTIVNELTGDDSR